VACPTRFLVRGQAVGLGGDYSEVQQGRPPYEMQPARRFGATTWSPAAAATSPEPSVVAEPGDPSFTGMTGEGNVAV